ncbi:MAG: protein kinase [Phycisphaerae bacterium]|nr:protein kinase [Phycisphaerae bacterium]MCZ2400481.1 protein kinase [Phycisphaerae bacterium]
MSDDRTQLAVLLFTDVVGSVQLKTRLGARSYASLVARHDALFSGVLGELPGAQILNDLGDGFLARFATAADAVQAALRFQEALFDQVWDADPLRVRIGVHVGQVEMLDEEPGGRRKVVGLAVDMAARLTDLALPGQILLTRGAFDDARQFLREGDRGEGDGRDGGRVRLHWVAHGRYLFKGNDDALEVFEVGLDGLSPLQAPPDSDKARRAVAADELETLGWRPARGLEIPRRAGWVLERKLGEGGFGEVWLARHRKTGDGRVFKFCFDAQKLRGLKREVALFRLIRSGLGERRDIARLHEVQLDQAPYFLECEFSEHGSLLDWASQQGGLERIPPRQRIALVARVAAAVDAAHSIGILHKDIKPANVLIYFTEDGEPRPRLADFGIGEVVDRSKLRDHNISMAGLTHAPGSSRGSSYTGTQMYLPPESQAGLPFTVRGDIYALGVLLYQMVAGDLRRPLGHGWQRDVADELLREDIERCVERDPERRLATAAELAERLDQLEERARQRERTRRRKQRETRLKSIVGMSIGAAAALFLLFFGAVGLLYKERWAKDEFRRAGQAAERAERTALAEAARARAAEGAVREEKLRALDALENAEAAAMRANEMKEFLKLCFTSIESDRARSGRGYGLVDLLDDAADRLARGLCEQPEVRAELHEALGRAYLKLGAHQKAIAQLDSAIEARGGEGDRLLLADAQVVLATACREAGGMALGRAESLAREALRTYDDERAAGDRSMRAIDLLCRVLLEHSVREKAREVVSLAERGLSLAAGDKVEDRQRAALLLTHMATAHEQLEEFDAAIQRHERAMELRRATDGPDSEAFIGSLCNVANLQRRIDPVRAVAAFDQALADARRALGAGHRLVLTLQAGRALCFVQARSTPAQLEEALAVLSRTYRPLKRFLGEHPLVIEVQGGVIDALLRLNRLGEADRWSANPDAEAAKHPEQT